MIDDRAQHATQGPCFGKWRGHNIPVYYMDPRVELGMMVPSMLSTVTK